MSGRKLSEEHKRKISLSRKGIKFSDEHKRNISLSRKEMILSDEHKRKISASLKGKRNSLGRKCSEETRQKLRLRRHSEETKRKIRESGIKYIEQKHFQGQPMYPRIGKNENKILDRIEKDLNINITRQYRVCGYFLDGYDEVNNVAYEVQEEYHSNEEQIEKDKIRQQNIMKELGCDFINIKDHNLGEI